MLSAAHLAADAGHVEVGKQNRRVMDHGICSWTGVLNTGLVLLGMNLMYMCGKMVAVWSFHFQRSYACYTSCSYHCWCLMVLAKLPYTVRCGQDVACLREVEDICNNSKGWSVFLVFDAKTCFFSTKDLPTKNREKHSRSWRQLLVTCRSWSFSRKPRGLEFFPGKTWKMETLRGVSNSKRFFFLWGEVR